MTQHEYDVGITQCRRFVVNRFQQLKRLHGYQYDEAVDLIATNILMYMWSRKVGLDNIGVWTLARNEAQQIVQYGKSYTSGFRVRDGNSVTGHLRGMERKDTPAYPSFSDPVTQEVADRLIGGLTTRAVAMAMWPGDGCMEQLSPHLEKIREALL